MRSETTTPLVIIYIAYELVSHLKAAIAHNQQRIITQFASLDSISYYNTTSMVSTQSSILLAVTCALTMQDVAKADTCGPAVHAEVAAAVQRLHANCASWAAYLASGGVWTCDSTCRDSVARGHAAGLHVWWPVRAELQASGRRHGGDVRCRAVRLGRRYNNDGIIEGSAANGDFKCEHPVDQYRCRAHGLHPVHRWRCATLASSLLSFVNACIYFRLTHVACGSLQGLSVVLKF
ncbi:unnamed protein product [Phytophthora lilii]|uniref:Unnamed protein product n=1 Tax=Phytophthora lilii TaxID=2077276 RepID=A0A9W7CLT1_9STRA|nr:unnamed protein product [Phytophthora lilii]